MCVRVAMRGIPLYSRNTARRHVCMYMCIYTKLQIRAISLGDWILKLSGFDFYIFILLNKYITFRALVILAKKNSKKI